MKTVFVPGVPAPQGSKRHIGKGILVESSKKVGPWRERVALALSEEMNGAPTYEPVRVAMEFLFPRPESHLRKDGSVKASAPRFPRRPDIDKLARAVLDAATGVAIVDDAQVVRLSAFKRYAEPGEESGGVLVCWSEVVE